MLARNLLVSFVALAMVLVLVATVSAETITSGYTVKVDGNVVSEPSNNWTVSVIAGEPVIVEVYFTSTKDASDVKVKVEIEGEKADVTEITQPFDVITNGRYEKILKIVVPSDLKDSLSDTTDFTVTIGNRDYETVIQRTLLIQRPSYDADIKSVTVSQTVTAGETIPVDIVLKNIGYNALDDLYVTVRIPALGVEKTTYFGDLVAIECDENSADCNQDSNDVDSVSGRLYLEVPYSVKAGVYTLEIEVKNGDMTSKVVKQISIQNDFPGNVIVTSSSKTVASGEDAVYDLLIVNPTDKLKVFRVVTESSKDLSTSVGESVVAVPAGSSKTVKVTASSDKEGDYTFNVNVFSGTELTDTVALNAKVEGTSSTSITSPIVVLTIILAIVFIVLLVVLVVLLGKKPEKSEEFGESYY